MGRPALHPQVAGNSPAGLTRPKRCVRVLLVRLAWAVYQQNPA
jgi:hypothetical protein